MKINEVLDIYTGHLPNTISEQRALIAIKHLRVLGNKGVRNVAEAIQGVGEAVFIDEWGGQHGVEDAPVDLES